MIESRSATGMRPHAVSTKHRWTTRTNRHRLRCGLISRHNLLIWGVTLLVVQINFPSPLVENRFGILEKSVSAICEESYTKLFRPFSLELARNFIIQSPICAHVYSHCLEESTFSAMRLILRVLNTFEILAPLHDPISATKHSSTFLQCLW